MMKKIIVLLTVVMFTLNLKSQNFLQHKTASFTFPAGSYYAGTTVEAEYWIYNEGRSIDLYISVTGESSAVETMCIAGYEDYYAFDWSSTPYNAYVFSEGCVSISQGGALGYLEVPENLVGRNLSVIVNVGIDQMYELLWEDAE